jgi:hypothetical protein
MKAMAIVVCVTFVWLTSEGNAAQMTSQRSDRGTKFLLIAGPIVSGDAAKFKRTIAAETPSIVVFDSPGGALVEGLEIGEMISARKMDTLVPEKTMCASACALAWLGGGKRFLDPTARIGFHAAYIRSGEYVRETGVGNALVGAYLANLGLSYVICPP